MLQNVEKYVNFLLHTFTNYRSYDSSVKLRKIKGDVNK